MPTVPRLPSLSLILATLLVPGCGARSSLLAPEVTDELCGDGVVDSGEACDDGNTKATDACTASCLFARCGDGVVWKGVEACDDQNDVDTDDCKNNCALPTCGNGVIDSGEECDDANADDTDDCTSRCFWAKCGDGFVHAGVEACDVGAESPHVTALLLRQGTFARVIHPVDSTADIITFYAYSSASGHTGFEAAMKSELYLHRHTPTGTLSLVTEHGIDLDTSDELQPETDVSQTFTGFPAGVSIAVLDDNAEELFMESGSSATGKWHFIHNTDGGAFSGLPLPGNWQVDVASTFAKEIDGLRFFDGDGSEIPLDLTTIVSILAQDLPACRPDCTLMKCGDGVIDAGEACDDSNTAGGDSCAADCSATQ